MKKQSLAVLAAVGITAAIAIPSIAFGNARRTDPNGTLSYLRDAQTPYIAQLTGPAELTGTTPTGDPDGVGAASVTFDFLSVTEGQVCFDLAYSKILAPNLAHIHRGAVGAAGPVVVDFGVPGATSHSGCVTASAGLVDEILGNPAGFYVNVHNTEFAAGAMRGQLAAGPAPAGEAHLLPTPLRAYDSRDNAGAKINAGETRTISLATGKTAQLLSQVAVPPGASAAIVTLTITETTGNGGFLKMYNAAITEPATSSINWAGVDQNVAVSTHVAVDPAGQVKIAAGANATHFVIDVVGYLF